MLYLICTMIFSVDLAHYGVSRAKDWVSVDYGTSFLDTLQLNPCLGNLLSLTSVNFKVISLKESLRLTFTRPQACGNLCHNFWPATSCLVFS